MTDIYRAIDRKALLGDSKLIFFGESIRFYHENNEDRIRYNHLKKLCNDKLAQLTKGQRTDFGGNFDAIIKKISNPETPEEKRFITRVPSPISKRHTELLLNIPLMKSYLDKNRVDPYRSTHYTTEHYGLNEKPIVITESLKFKVIRAKRNSISRLDYT